MWSLQEPDEKPPMQPTHSGKRKRDGVETSVRSNYFPMSCEHELGSLPIPPFQSRGKHTFPHNISFRTADWVSTKIPEDKEGYNVVVAYAESLNSAFYKCLNSNHQLLLVQMDTFKRG